MEFDDKVMENLGPFLSWARYLASANIVRERFEVSLEEPDRGDYAFGGSLPSDALCSYWYAGLYVVIEGWEELNFIDPVIDSLLKHDEGYVSLLRRYRNGTFHYQNNLLNNKRLDLIETGENHVYWIRLLHGEFCRFFRQCVDSFPGTEEQREDFRTSVKHIVGWIPEIVTESLQEAQITVERFTRELQWLALPLDGYRQGQLALHTDICDLAGRVSRQLFRPRSLICQKYFLNGLCQFRRSLRVVTLNSLIGNLGFRRRNGYYLTIGYI